LHDIALLLFLYGALASWYAYADRSVASWIAGGCAVIFLIVGCGVWFAREWARWPCALIALLLAVRNLAMFLPVKSMVEVLGSGANGLVAGTIGVVLLLLLTALWIAIACYCLRPSTRTRFAEVRQARTRVAPS
jgi:hypothetical protein